MTTYLPRTAWDARAPRQGPGRLNAGDVAGVALHWPGMEQPLHSYADVAAGLRGWQNWHMDGHGWSDIAYQVAVDQAGRAWTLRGLATQSAANGDADVNTRFGAVLLVLAPGEEPSDAMADTVREVVDDFRALYPAGTKIVPHSAVRPDPTDCPGPAARAAITRGLFTPGLIEEEIDMSAAAELKAQGDRIEKAIAKLAGAEAARYADLANRVQAGNDEERGRYKYYSAQFGAIRQELADDPASPVTQDLSS